MDKTLEPFDLHRIFIGDSPWLFLLEIVFRTLIMYSYTVLLLRLLGKRGMGQLSMLELAIIISFGSAVGDPMMGADIPIFHGMIAVTVVTAFQIALEKFINARPKMEAVMEGTPDVLIKDGVIDWEAMRKANMSREDLFRALRQKDVEQLGEIKTALFETTGGISIFRQPAGEVRPGLSTLPQDLLPAALIAKAGHTVHIAAPYACTHCGAVKTVTAAHDALQACQHCQCGQYIRIEENNPHEEAD